MPADARVESERALAGYRQDLAAVEEGKRRAKMVGRYHMVRFFGALFSSHLRTIWFLERGREREEGRERDTRRKEMTKV